MATLHDADVIVIGAGSGGLTAAAYLAVAGEKVVVVDRGKVPGGMTAAFTRDGYEFDIGLHYLGSDRRGAPVSDGLLAPLGIELSYARLDPTDTVLLPDGIRFEVPTGLDAYRERLHDALPAEHRAVDRFLELADALDAHVDALSEVHGLTDLPAALQHTAPLVRHGRTTLGEQFDRLHLSPRARTLLAWINGTYGLPPSEVPFIGHALVSMYYLHGAWYPHGGGQVVADRLADVIREHGGGVLLEHEVTRIVVRAGHVTGIEARDPHGEPVELSAPAVVASGDLKRTFGELLDHEVVPNRLRRRVRGYEMALPLAVLYLVIDRDLAAEGMPPTNHLVVPDDDLERHYRTVRRGAFPEQPIVFISSPSLKDPGNDRYCPPGQTNLQLMTIVPPQPRAWGLQVGVERGEAYRAAKSALHDRMLEVAERAVPGLRDALVFDEVATPATFTRYLGVTDGTSYGIAATSDQMVFGRPGPKTPIDGLFLAGASARAGHGITGVMAGGVAAASAVLGTSAVVAVRAARRTGKVVAAA